MPERCDHNTAVANPRHCAFAPRCYIHLRKPLITASERRVANRRARAGVERSADIDAGWLLRPHARGRSGTCPKHGDRRIAALAGPVFHRPDGSRIKDFHEAWKTACEEAGYPGKLLHDFRRSAVRTLERSGVPRSSAMAMVGHKTESIYRRYAIVDEQMHREAAAKLDAWAEDQKAKAKAERKGQVRRFGKRRVS